MSATELLTIARNGRPNVRYATNDKRNAIGAWEPSLSRYVVVAALGIHDKWLSMPFELLINGQPVSYVWDESL